MAASQWLKAAWRAASGQGIGCIVALMDNEFYKPAAALFRPAPAFLPAIAPPSRLCLRQPGHPVFACESSCWQWPLR